MRERAEVAADTAGFAGKIEWDRTKPVGTPWKLMDSSRMRALNWKPRTTLPEGLRTIAALCTSADSTGQTAKQPQGR